MSSVLKYALIILFVFSPFYSVFSQVQSQTHSEKEKLVPHVYDREKISADIDTVGQLVYIYLRNEIWKYDLVQKGWTLLDSVNISEVNEDRLEFGYEQTKDRLLFWSGGIGKVFEYDLDQKELKRIDKSFAHKNQYGHFPFFRDGTLYAFGGYGFWDWHNLITFFNTDLEEWSVVNLNRESKLPTGRVPRTGVYISERDQLLIYGGNTAENILQDDQFKKTQYLSDIWKFDFSSNSWDLMVHQIDKDSYMTGRYNSVASRHGINVISTSTYSPLSETWYIPLRDHDNTHRIFLQPVDTETFEVYEPIEIFKDQNAEMLVPNYLFDPKEENLVLLTIPRKTNVDQLPLTIRTIPEDLLLDEIKKNQQNLSVLQSGIAGAAFLAILFLAFILKRKNGSTTSVNTDEYRQKGFDSFKWLSETERTMVDILKEHNYELDSSDLEEKVWPDIENFDYRRKLRNDTINSINKKFKKHTDLAGSVILRHKDPSDKRRHIYSLSEEFRTH